MISVLKLQRGIVLRKDTISILIIYKITKGHKTAKNVEEVSVHNQNLVILLFVLKFVIERTRFLC